MFSYEPLSATHNAGASVGPEAVSGKNAQQNCIDGWHGDVKVLGMR